MNARLGPVLANHVSFFDADGDGVIKRRELRQRLRALGLPRWRATFDSWVFAVFRGPKSSGRWTLDIDVKGIHRSILKGTTGTFDAHGQATEQRIDELLDRLDPERTGRITEPRIHAVVLEDAPVRRHYRNARAGWGLLMMVAGGRGPDRARYVTREQVRSLYRGTLFYEVALERLSEREQAGAGDPQLRASLERGYRELLRSLGQSSGAHAGGDDAGTPADPGPAVSRKS